MTRSKHAHPQDQHQKLSGWDTKKHGAGSHNWGGNDEEIREGIELSKSEDYVNHSSGDASNHKITISPLQSPSLSNETGAKELQPSA
ncbi:hypothetical protein JCM8547_004314 [Rhodosporidiobolus lusitaniae]